MAKSYREALKNTHAKLHATEHLLVGMIRKYGTDGHATLEEECYVGAHAVTITATAAGGTLHLVLTDTDDVCPCQA